MPKKAYSVILLAILIVVAAYNWRFLKVDSSPPLFDENMYYSQTEDMVKACRGSGWFSRPDLFFSRQFPPLVPAVGALFCCVFGVSGDSAIFSIIVFLALLVASVYKLGGQLYDERTGFWGAVFMLLLPAVTGMSRTFYLEIPMAAMVSLCLYLLLKSERFRSTGYSVLFGVAFAGMLLTKLMTLIYFLGPAAMYCMRPLLWERRQLRNAGIAAIVCLAILLPFSSVFYVFFSEYGLLVANSSAVGIRPFFIGIQPLWEWLLLPFFFIAFAAALPFFVARQQGRALLLGWFFVPFGFFTLITLFSLPKEARFLVPCLPAVALIISATVNRVKDKTLRPALLTVLTVGGALGLYRYTLDPDPSIKGSLRAVGVFCPAVGRYEVDTADWHDKELFDLFLKGAAGKKEIVVLPIFVSDRIFYPLHMRAEQLKAPPFVLLDPYIHRICGGYEGVRPDDFYRWKIESADYVLMLKGGYRRAGLDKIPGAREPYKRFLRVASECDLVTVASFRMPDGKELIVFRPRKPGGPRGVE